MNDQTHPRRPLDFPSLERFTITADGIVHKPDENPLKPLTREHAIRELIAKDPFYGNRHQGRKPVLNQVIDGRMMVATIHLPKKAIDFEKEYARWLKIPPAERDSEKNQTSKPRPAWFEPDDELLAGDVENGWARIEIYEVGFWLLHGPSVAARLFRNV